MKKLKIFIFIFILLAFFAINIYSASATEVNGSVTVTVNTPCNAPTGYTYCADENAICTVPSISDVKFGCDPTFNHKEITTSTECTNDVFGETLNGVVKKCFYKLLDTYYLSVSKVGLGTVTGTGINCGSDCSESYTEGTNTNVSLSAVPDSGYVFAGWSEDCSGTSCSLIMSEDKNVTATFTVSAAKTNPTCTVNNSPKTYNGSSQAVTVAPSTPGSITNVKYDGSSTVPTNAKTSYVITADFAPKDSTNYNSLSGATCTGGFAINKADQATLTVTPQTVTYISTGNNFTTLATTGGSGTGTVSFPIYATGIAGCSLSGTNNSTLSYATAGTCSVTATKAGDTNYNSKTSESAIFTVSSALVMSGTLTSSASSCTIASGASTCPVTLTFTVTNPENALASAIISGTNNSGASSSNFAVTPPVTTGTVDSGTSTNVAVPYSSRTFYLYNNSKSLVPTSTSPYGAGITVTSSCTAGTTWNGSICANILPVANAGPDKAITLPTTTSAPTGTSATDTAPGTISSTNGTVWTQVGSTPSVATITNSTTLTPSFSGLSTAGTYTFRLTVTDNNGGTGTDDMKVVVSVGPPTLTTDTINLITQTTATGGGNITSNGGATVTVSGIAWSTSINPTYDPSSGPLSGNVGQRTDGPVSGAWTGSMTFLSAGTTYHVRAYAKNSVNTSYGSDVIFTTSPTFTATVASSSSINLSWVAPQGTIYNYTLVRSDIMVSPIYSGTDLSYPDTGLTANKSYTYTLNPSGTGAPYGTATVSGTPMATLCSSPTQNVTVACDANAYGDSAISGLVTRSQTKSLYTDTPSCSFPALPVTTSNSTYVSETCAYPTRYTITFNGNGSTSGLTATQTISQGASANLTANGFSKTANGFAGWATTSGGAVAYANGASYTMGTSNVNLYAKWTPNTCLLPLTQNVTVACDANAYGDSAISGLVTRSQTKSLYTDTPSCSFPALPVTTSNSTYVSDNCVYPNPTMSGTLTSSKTSCEIAPNESSCPVTLTFAVTNPENVLGSAVTSDTNNSGNASANFAVTPSVTTGTVDAGTKTLVAVPYSSRTFYLYNNFKSLVPTSPSGGGITVTSSCVAGSHWDPINKICDTVPTLDSSQATNITSTTATLGARITSAGIPNSISERGVCYVPFILGPGNLGTPILTNINATCVKDGNNTSLGVFTVDVNNLSPLKKYAFRGYATNTTGTGYSAETSFTTLAACANGATNPPTCTTCIAGSAIIGGTCTPVTVGVTASPTTYNTIPNTNVSILYTPTTNTGAVQCKLLDNNLADLTAYASATKDVVNTKTYASPNGVGAYGYYIRCQNTTTTTAIATSSLITVNTACAAGSDFVSGVCRVRPIVIFNKNGGDNEANPTTKTVVYGSTVGTLPTAPVKTGSTFTNWNTLANGTGSAFLATTSVTANITVFAQWSLNACANGATNPPTCTTCIAGSAIIGGTCTPVTVGVTASPTTYNTIPNTNVSILYTPTTNTGNTECRLLDNTSTPLPPTTYKLSTPTNNSITFTPPVSAGAYGYYVQCRNTINTTVMATSAKITITVFTVSVTASTPYNVTPNTSVSFTYTPTTNSGTAECLLQDNLFADKTVYKLSSPITYTIPNNIGSYGYYVKCRNTTTTTAMATSAKITVNMACANGLPGTTWNGFSCVAPGGTLTASDCKISAGANSCNSNVSWTMNNPVAIPTAITASGMIPDENVTNTLATPQSGIKFLPVPYPSRKFYLYNNGEPSRADDIAYATCTDTPIQTFWDGSKCVTPEGTLSVSPCTILAGGSTCPVTLNWSISNPVGTSTLRTPNVASSPFYTSASGATSGTTSYPYTVSSAPSAVTFHLVNSGISTSATSTVSCVPSYHWGGSSCVIDNPTTTFTVNNATTATIFKGRSATLRWDSPLSTSCTGTRFSTGGAISNLSPGVTVSPLATTTYTLTCTNSTGSTSNDATTKVITLTIKEQ